VAQGWSARVSSPTVGVLAVHGMGLHEIGFSRRLEANVRRELARGGDSAVRIVWCEGYWADLLKPRELSLWDRLSAGNGLRCAWLRRFVISAFGDAIAYRPVPTTRPTTYTQIHWRIYEKLEELASALPARDCPLILAGHSLGSVILSDHVWDEQHRQGHGRDGFTRAETLAGLLTFGSTIPMFTLGLEQIVAIGFPGAALSPACQAAAQWLNVYNRADVLGYPLKPTSPDYDRTVHRDIEMNVGNLLTSWNPLSHAGYWTSGELARTLGGMIQRVAGAS
jgi:hypothetical protein